jgi:hypothetical protein
MHSDKPGAVPSFVRQRQRLPGNALSQVARLLQPGQEALSGTAASGRRIPLVRLAVSSCKSAPSRATASGARFDWLLRVHSPTDWRPTSGSPRTFQKEDSCASLRIMIPRVWSVSFLCARFCFFSLGRGLRPINGGLVVLRRVAQDCASWATRCCGSTTPAERDLR